MGGRIPEAMDCYMQVRVAVLHGGEARGGGDCCGLGSGRQLAAYMVWCAATAAAASTLSPSRMGGCGESTKR